MAKISSFFFWSPRSNAQQTEMFMTYKMFVLCAFQKLCSLMSAGIEQGS